MKNSLLSLVLATALFHQTLQAQDVSKLTLPASPAFSILNYEPSAVMRPTNVKSLATDILNSFDKDGKLMLNLGLEVTPYWLASHPDLKMKTYLKSDLGRTILQSFSLSAATVKDSAQGKNKLGAGFRFKLYNGESAKDPEALELAMRNLKAGSTVSAIVNILAKTFDYRVVSSKQKAIEVLEENLVKAKTSPLLIDAVKKLAKGIESHYTDSNTDIKNFLIELGDEWTNGLKDLQAKVSDLLYQRKGFVIELAGASAYNTTATNNLERIGLWGNVSYYVSPDDLFSLTGRYMNQTNDTSQTNFDLGLGFLKKNNKYNISIEYMCRWYRAEIPDINIFNQKITRVEKNFTYRVAAQGSYIVSNDISINISLGKDFDSPLIAGSSFFSILGLNYSIFSRDPIKLK